MRADRRRSSLPDLRISPVTLTHFTILNQRHTDSHNYILLMRVYLSRQHHQEHAHGFDLHHHFLHLPTFHPENRGEPLWLEHAVRATIFDGRSTMGCDRPSVADSTCNVERASSLATSVVRLRTTSPTVVSVQNGRAGTLALRKPWAPPPYSDHTPTMPTGPRLADTTPMEMGDE